MYLLRAGGTDLRAVLTDGAPDSGGPPTSSHDGSAEIPEAHSELKAIAQGTKRPAAVSSAAGNAAAKRHAPHPRKSAQPAAKDTEHARLPSAAPKLHAATPDPVQPMPDTNAHKQKSPNCSGASSKARKSISRARANAAGDMLADQSGLAEQQHTFSFGGKALSGAAKATVVDKVHAPRLGGQQSAGRRPGSRYSATTILSQQHRMLLRRNVNPACMTAM